MLNTQQIAQIKQLKKQGNSLGKISRTMGISVPTVRKYCKAIKANRSTKNPPPIENIIETEEPIIETETSPIDPQDPTQEAMVEVKGFPVGKKIFLTPKNITMYQWFKSNYPHWDGEDLSDFINQAMGFFFTEGLNAKMKVEVVQELN